jgi:hypothetical protein
MAAKIAGCAPLGIKTTLTSAHLAIDGTEAEALSKLDTQFGALFRTEDFEEGRKAEAEGRPPIYQGKYILGLIDFPNPGNPGIALVRIFSGRSSNRSSSFAEASKDRSVKIAGVRIYLNVDQGWALSLKGALQCLVDIA